MATRRTKIRRTRIAWGLLIGAVIIVLLLGVIAWRAALRQDAFDAVTLCPRDGAYPRTAVLIDASDTLSASQVKTLGEHLSALRTRLADQEWVGLFVLREDNLVLPAAEIALCNPGSDANPLYENPRQVRRRFDEKFSHPLNEALARLAESQRPQEVSPILEMVEAVALDRNFDATQPRRLIIVSDMLQNTADYSHYREQGAPDFAQFRAGDYGRRFVGVDLQDVRVEILYLKREEARAFQTTAHIDFWSEYFDRTGATLEKVTPLR